MLLIVPLAALCTLAVDWGRVEVAHTELRRCADAAARAAVVELPNQSNARAQAVSIAALNSVNGAPVSLYATDIEFGKWDGATATFNTASTSPDSVRVTARRTAARGEAIPLLFGKLIGQASCDVSTSAIACQSGKKVQLVGLTGITIQNNFFGGTYHSSLTTSPSHATVEDGAIVASNAVISAGTNERLDGVILGPSGSSNLTTSDGTTVLTQNLSFPLPTSPGPASGSISVSGTNYIAGGTYYCNDLTINSGCSLIFTGPTVIYFSGNVKFNGDVNIRPASNVPGDLKIYHTATGSFGSTTANDVDIIADMYCPGCDFAVKNNAILHGRFIFRTVTAKNNLDFYYDDSLSPLYVAGTGGGNIKVVK